MYGGQAAETDGLAVVTHSLRQFVAGLEAPGFGRKLAVLRFQHQCLEGLESPGTVVSGIQVNGPARYAQLFPALDLPGKNLRQLPSVQLGNWVVGVDEDCDAVEADHVFGACCAQVTQRLQLADFTVVDRPRGSGQVCFATAQRNKAGA